MAKALSLCRSRAPATAKKHRHQLATPVVARPAARALSQSPSSVSSSGLTTVVSGHPDAIKRRQEQEAERQRREAERAEQRAREAEGVKWWQGPLPDNMVSASCASNLKDLVRKANSQGALAVITYFNEDCYVCRTLHPKLKKIATDNPDVLFIKANGSQASIVPVFEALGIDRVPLFHFVREGEIKCTMTCSASPERLQLLRAEIAANKASAVHPTVPWVADSPHEKRL